MKATHTLKVLIAVLVVSTSIHAQTNVRATSDEQTIRNLVAQQNGGKNVIKYTDDHIFVSGAYPMPLIGKQMSAENQEADKRAKERKNFTAKFRIERLEVAKGGDMAYEFGYADLAYDTPENKHESFEASYLRVWQKLQGEWKVAVFFARPNKS